MFTPRFFYDYVEKNPNFNQWNTSIIDMKIDINCQMLVLRSAMAANNDKIAKIVINGYWDSPDRWFQKLFEDEGIDITQMEKLVIDATKKFNL